MGFRLQDKIDHVTNTLLCFLTTLIVVTEVTFICLIVASRQVEYSIFLTVIIRAFNFWTPELMAA